MTKRVVVFIDYQNVYHSARDAFHSSGGPHWIGQVNPRALGNLIVDLDNDTNRVLEEVRIYRGLPSNSKDPKGYGATRRQMAAWGKLPWVEVTARPLRYPRNYPDHNAEEKGIDVQIAVDFVIMAVRREYDIGILMSGDTDLLPAIEAVTDLGTATAEVAAWKPPTGQGRRLHIKGRSVRCHWIEEHNYITIQDNTDYNIR